MSFRLKDQLGKGYWHLRTAPQWSSSNTDACWFRRDATPEELIASYLGCETNNIETAMYLYWEEYMKVGRKIQRVETKRVCIDSVKPRKCSTFVRQGPTEQFVAVADECPPAEYD